MKPPQGALPIARSIGLADKVEVNRYRRAYETSAPAGILVVGVTALLPGQESSILS